MLLPATAQLSEHHNSANSPRPETRPTWEQNPNQFPDEPQFVPQRRTERTSVSLDELRNPLKGKALDLMRKAQKLLSENQPARAMETLRKALEYPEARPYALSMLGVEHLRAGMLTEAVDELEEATRLLPGSAANHNNLAFALGQKGEEQRALVAARKALQLDPGNPKTRYILGHLLLLQGQTEEALFHLSKAVDEVPSARALLDRYQAWVLTTVPVRTRRNPVPAAVMSFQTK